MTGTTMPDVYLTGSEERSDEALSILEFALVTPNDTTKRIVVTRTDSTQDNSSPLEARYLSIKSVFREVGQIVIRPADALDIAVRTEPLRHQRKEHHTAFARHLAYVDHHGDFVHIVNPYYFYEDRHAVSYQKYCFHVPGLASR